MKVIAMKSKNNPHSILENSPFLERITILPKKNKGIKVLLIIIISLLFTNCYHSKQKFYTKPNSYIIDQLANKRIAMLGDFMHSSPASYESLMSLLDEWLVKIKNGESKNYNVVLILEADTQEVSVLKRFISSGDWEPFLKYWLPYNSLEWLEFCSNLRSFENEIKQFNEDKDNAKINFDIFGGEDGNIFDQPKMLSYSELEGSKLFVDKRDSISAKNIINFLIQHKSAKAIIFYGNLHLIKNYVNKNLYDILPNNEAYGYYLAHYLKQEFGDGQVLSINQYEVAQQTIFNAPFFATNACDIFVYSRYIPWKNLQPENYDAFILRHDSSEIRGHSLGNFFSINVINADIKKMQFLKKYFPGYLAEGYYNIAQQSLRLITGKNFNTVSQWQNWINNNVYNGAVRLDSKKFEDDMYDLYYQNFDNNQIKSELYLMGIGSKIANRQVLSKSQWDILWKESLPKIKFLNEVGIYWIGTKEEKRIAQKYLEENIDRIKYGELKEPEDYLNLYRKIYENVK